MDTGNKGSENDKSEINSERLKKDINSLNVSINSNDVKSYAEVKKKEKSDSIEKERQMIIFTLNNEKFATNIDQIKEIQNYMEITQIPESDRFVEGVINLRNKIIVIVNLCKRLSLPQKNIDNQTKFVILEHDGGSIGVIVDSVLEVKKFYEYQVKKPSTSLAQRINTEDIEGVIIHEKEVIIILNFLGLFKDKFKQFNHLSNNINSDTINPRLLNKTPSEKTIEKHEAKEKIEVEKTNPKKEDVLLKDNRTTGTVVDNILHKEAPDDKFFEFPDGIKVKTLKELIQKIESLDEEIYSRFVDKNRNYFADWIEHVLGDAELSKKIRTTASKQELMSVLNKFTSEKGKKKEEQI